MTRNKDLKIAVAVMAAAVILGFWALLGAYAEKPIKGTANYSIHVYDNGAATIGVDNIGHVYQLQERADFGAGQYLRPGTLIIPGDGDKAICEYPQRTTYIEEE